ncbi:uncharacterized protein HKW66_Vig0224620 [Vigna angularis]|uniref:Uncharacterized protein n=1 Tax=Phaseolus angularis TaxID=3914 RepID=A0A8T0K1T6_PHAAN|nr:uncharacterized protein HKW66_Vig0224620 [Vigna angularis]
MVLLERRPCKFDERKTKTKNSHIESERDQTIFECDYVKIVKLDRIPLSMQLGDWCGPTKFVVIISDDLSIVFIRLQLLIYRAYIGRVKERYGGRWICGLCSEAVKEEREREKIMITTDEALKRHMRFCQQFRSSTPPDSTNEDFILAVKQILFRTLDSPRKDRFICRPLGRSQSCFSTMQGTQQAERE